MDSERTYSILNSESSASEKRRTLVTYLQDRVSNVNDNPDQTTAVAYDIAGLMSTSYALSLEDDDPIEEILTLAGELEVPDPENYEKWAELIRLVSKL